MTIWAKILELEQIGIEDDFFDLGGDSILAARLFTEIEQQLGQKLPLASLFQHSNISQQAALIRHQTLTSASATWPTLVPIQKGGNKPPLFYVHPLGGNVLCYRDLAVALGPEYPLYGLQAFGLNGINSPYSQVDQIAAHYIQEICAIQTKGPYFLGGFSFGGLVAFEMARQLKQQGEEIGLLALFDTNAPGSMLPLTEMTEQQKVLLYWQQKIAIHWDNLRHLQPHRRWPYLEKRLRLLPNLAAHLRHSLSRLLNSLQVSSEQPLPKNTQVLDAIESIRTANRTANDAYQLQPYSGRITLFQALKEPVGYARATANGWATYANGGVTIHAVPSDHNTIMAEPWVHLVAEQLKIDLGHAQSAE